MGSASPHPLADTVRERTALEVFPYRNEDARVWAARHAHELRWFNFHRFRYREPALEAWLVQVGGVLTSPSELEAARRRHQSQSQRLAIMHRPDRPGPRRESSRSSTSAPGQI